MFTGLLGSGLRHRSVKPSGIDIKGQILTKKYLHIAFREKTIQQVSVQA
jgi:hypothetical protein